jgi:SUR7/PalI family
MMFLTLLGGASNSKPLNDIYFLQTDTSSIPGAPSVSRWTFWNICSVVDGRSQCGSSHPAYPFNPPSSDNFGTTDNIPAAFIG